MRQCPKCDKWTMDFDDYFGRFRCFDGQCGWMPPSTTEREIRLLRSHTQPTRLKSVEIPELELTLTPSYDPENDAFSIDFGSNEPTFDLPELDGQMIWRIGRRSDRVAGFTIVGARKASISGISIEFIVKRKRDIEERLQRTQEAVLTGQATRYLIDQVIVMALSKEEPVAPPSPEVQNVWREVVSKLEELVSA